MSLVINTNISSLVAQNNLNGSQSALAKATERLSSGLKINSAADNAAGFAIATNFQTQIGGLAQASNNASDAINLAQTAGSALNQVTSNLQAIRDLAVQAANGTYSASNRQQINTEVQQRLQEITRIANQTSFNGTNVLNGSAGTLSFQIGANVGQAIDVNLSQGVQSSQIGQIAQTSSGNISSAFGYTITGSNLSIAGTSVTGTFSSVSGLANAINTQLGTGSSVTASVNANGELTLTNAGTGSVTVSGSSATTLGLSTGSNVLTSGASETSTNAASETSSLTLTGTALTVNGTAITGTFSSVQSLVDTINANGLNVSASVNGAQNGFNLFSNSTMEVGAVSGGVLSGSSLTTGAIAVTGSLQNGNVLTVDSANALVAGVDAALNSVSNLASDLGAVQNRFQSTIATLSAQSTNLQSSQSSIQDANFAQETANLSKSQVLEQAGISVLAQANAQPQQVLKLLG
ncbi:flagellin [Dyella sp. A6]|uniref:flagellin N-terminal helical domain-containing protein n=1 Tax=Dyella aluminiiresistens TaxID=3069105 RepID=UPI002E7A4D29|nr:flagellin [Dyella sp. A6]